VKEPPPSPKTILATRKAANLTQTEAAALVHTTLRTWQRYEAGDRHMHPAFWELFEIKCGRDNAGSNSTRQKRGDIRKT
jgi:putative transcriptional regulator